MTLIKVFSPTIATAVEVRNDRGYLIGAVAPVAVPGLPPVSPFSPVVHFVGWAHDWEAINRNEGYVPVCLGVDEDYHTLVSEIEKRARDAQF